jgi:hypothetical protein
MGVWRGEHALHIHSPSKEDNLSTHQFTRVVATGAAVLVAGIASAVPASAAAHHRHHHRHHHASNPIPQHNGGDRDADNNGGPSDGDGNV